MVENNYYPTNSKFLSVRRDLDAQSLSLTFEHDISILIQSWWRLIKDGKIILTGEDEGQIFGMNEHIVTSERLLKELHDQFLKKLDINKLTGDLNLIFTGGLKMEVLISSSGYESYILNIKGKQIIGGGGGEIYSFNN